MKNKRIVFPAFLFLICVSVLQLYAQTGKTPKYISLTFIKSTSDEFLTVANQWTPVHNQLVNDGRKLGWYLYKVKYPGGKNAQYDFVMFNVFEDWKQAESPANGIDAIIPKVLPGKDATVFRKSTDQTHEIVWEHLLSVIDEAVTKVHEPSKYIIVNQVKTVPGAGGEYVNLERTYFKPFHAERVAIGIMHNWGLYKPILPYGEKYEYDYVTLNGYATWEDIMKTNPPGPWKKAHGNLGFDEIHSKILSKRITVNNELWELVASAVGR